MRARDQKKRNRETKRDFISLCRLIGTAPAFAFMSVQADVYRQKAADAKDRAAQAKNPSIKSAFEEVANGWLLLA
jgi:hypothetical protein